MRSAVDVLSVLNKFRRRPAGAARSYPVVLEAGGRRCGSGCPRLEQAAQGGEQRHGVLDVAATEPA